MNISEPPLRYKVSGESPDVCNKNARNVESEMRCSLRHSAVP